MAGVGNIPRSGKDCGAAQRVFTVCVDTRPTRLLESGGGDFLPRGFLSAGGSSCLKTLYLSPVSGQQGEEIVITSDND